MPVGTYTLADLFAARFANAKAFGFDNIAAVLQADVANHNALVGQMLTELCEVTEDARRLYGSSQDAVMSEVDEFGLAPDRKSVV